MEPGALVAVAMFRARLFGVLRVFVVGFSCRKYTFNRTGGRSMVCLCPTRLNEGSFGCSRFVAAAAGGQEIINKEKLYQTADYYKGNSD